MRRNALALALAAVAVLAGCTQPEPAPPQMSTTVPPIANAGGFGDCHSQAAQQMAVPFDARSTTDAQGRGAGIHRLNATTFLWVWATYNDTQRQDHVTRLNSVDVYREPDETAPLAVCTRAEIAAPTRVDGTRRSYAVAAIFTAPSGLPEGSIKFVVDWVAGCPCDPLPRGNMTRIFAQE